MGWDEKQWKSLNHWLFSLTRHKGSWGNRTVSGCPLRIQQDQKKRQLSKLGPKLLAIGLAEVVRLLVWVCFFFPFFPPSLLRQQNHSYMLLEKDEVVQEAQATMYWGHINSFVSTLTG